MRALHPLTFAALLLGWSSSHAAPLRTSTVTVHVHRKGFLFSPGVDYTMVAPIVSGSFDPNRSNVDVVVNAKDLSVADAKVAEPVRHEIEDTMRGPRVLDSATFPEIHFSAVQVTETAPEQFRVTGTLQMHGVAQQLALDFGGAGGHYHGRVTLHPSDFGIPPLTFAGGLVRMKDEIDVEFDLVGGASEPPSPSPSTSTSTSTSTSPTPTPTATPSTPPSTSSPTDDHNPQ
jgi:hypothetical protein